MKIYKDQSVNKLYLSHIKYLKKILEYFGMQDRKPMSTPLAAYFRLSLSLSSKSYKKNKHMSEEPNWLLNIAFDLQI
jgi:hypothetical protein